MSLEQLNSETIELTKQAFAKTNAGLEKAITTSLGLVGYNLEAPAKRLYPVLSPLRNRIPRTKAPVGSLAANWRSITGINTANVKAAVAFGTRSSTTITYTTVDRSATYKSFGLDDSVEDESIWLGRGFEDVRALSALSTLQSVMIEEEKLLLGGNVTALATPTAPTLTASGSGSSLTTATHYVKVMALPLYGWLNTDRVDMDSIGDHSAASSVGSVSVTAGNDLICSTGYVPAAFAYAWFVGTTNADGSLYLSAVTSVPAAKISSLKTALSVTGAGAANAADSNSFDGLFPQIIPVGSTLTTLGTSAGAGTLKKVTAGPAITGALVYDMDMVSGDGEALTSDNAGGIVEFDEVLKALWDEARIGPTLILINSQEALNITKKIGGSSNLGYRVNVSDGQKDITGGIFVSGYLNKFSSSLTPGNPDVVPFMIHPYLPPSTIIFLSERLPYPNNQVPNVLEMEMQQEYADFEWARTQRKYEHGVYANGVLKHYFPAGCAVIRGVKNA